MKGIFKLTVKIGSEYKTIEFGEPTTKSEKEEMFELRHHVYNEKGYFIKSYSAKEIDIDTYDNTQTTKYFIARLEDEIIGSVRMIKGEKLPTEIYFEFKAPKEIALIPEEFRAEVSRLVIKKPGNGIYLPRNIVMLFLLKALVQEARKQQIVGGYMFLKLAVRQKLRLLRTPIHLVRGYTQTYPKNEILAPYFFNKKDKVIPAYFNVNEIDEFLKGITDNTWIFKNNGRGEYIMKNSIYCVFLRALKII